MQLPAPFPKELEAYREKETERDLLDALKEAPPHFVAFFDAAAGDETWSFEHADFMKEGIEWATQAFLNGQLILDQAKSIRDTIYQHIEVLHSYLPTDIEFQVEDATFPLNSLLAGTSSESLRDAIRQKQFELSGVSKDLFALIAEAIETGTDSQLWKREKDELFKLLRLINQMGMDSLAHDCERTLSRYLNEGNVIEWLIEAHVEGWKILRKAAMDFVNSLSRGVEFKETAISELGLDFFDFKENALAIFEPVHTYLTHLGFRGDLITEAPFSELIGRTPKLVGIDLSRTTSSHERIMDLPVHLLELNLSKCSWLEDGEIKKIFDYCPNLTKLSLASNAQISYKGWSHLNKLKKLERLDLSRCHQMRDREFSMVLSACPNLTHLILEGCSEITDRQFTEIPRHLPKLRHLDVTRTQMGDTGVVEIGHGCSQIVSLNLTRCEAVSEKGILELVSQASTLKRLDLSHCPIPEFAFREIQRLRPDIQIIY